MKKKLGLFVVTALFSFCILFILGFEKEKKINLKLDLNQEYLETLQNIEGEEVVVEDTGENVSEEKTKRVKVKGVAVKENTTKFGGDIS